MVYAHMTLEKVNICDLVELSAKDWPPSLPTLIAVKSLAENWLPRRPRSPDDKLCTPHYWPHKAVRPGVQAELIDFWYRDSTFHFEPSNLLCRNKSPVGALECLSFILQHDRFGFRLGLKPRQLIHKTVVAIDLR
jgi:hypothetical protein